MATIESYLQNSPLPQDAKADAWEAYQTPDHDSFVSSIGKLKVPQNVKADMYEMRYGVKNQPLAPIPKPADPILNGPEAQYKEPFEGYNGVSGGWEKPTIDVDKMPLYTHMFDPNTTSKASIVAQHTAKFIADQTTGKNAAIMAGAEIGAPLIGAGIEAAGPALGYSEKAVASGADKAVQGAHRVMAGYFGAMGAKGTLDNYRQTVKDAVAGKPIAGDVTDTVLNGTMAAFGLRGLAHDEAPSVRTQPPVDSPIADHPKDRNESVAPLQGRLFPETEHSAPTVPNDTTPGVSDTQQLSLDFHPGQRDLFAQHGADYTPPAVEPTPAKEPTTPTQMQLMPWQGNLFPKESEEASPSVTSNLQQLVMNPAQGRLFSVKGEALPPQEAEAGPMSPEAEAVSKVAQDLSQKAPSSTTTEGPIDSGGTPAKGLDKLEDSIRSQTGQVLRLNQLLEGNKVHAALKRGIEDFQNTNDPRARNVGPGITPEDQKILSIAMGEKVGRTLTPDQVDKAYSLRGKVMGEQPELQLRPNASRDRLAASRAEMAKDLATTEDPALKAKLQDALQPNEDGKLKPFLYEPARKNAPAVTLDADHPEAPFSSKTFGAPYPEISTDNLETALGYRPRSKDMGMGDPDTRAVLKQQKAQVTAEGAGTVKENTAGFGYDTPNNPKGITGDAAVLNNQYFEGAVRAQAGKIGAKLRDDVKAYQSLRDPSQPSPLIDQLKGLHPDTLPKEVRELVKPPKPKTSETDASAATRVRPQTAEKRNSTPASTSSTLGKAKSGIVNLYEDFKKNKPEQLKNVQTIIQKAADHFGNDTDGAMVASFHALKIFKQGVENGNDWAMRDAIKAIRQLTPLDGSNEGNASAFSKAGGTTVNTRGGSTLYSGLDPEIGKGIAKDVFRAGTNLKNYIMPKLNEEDLAVSSDFHANALLSRYEQMTPTNRSAYRAQLHSDEVDRAVAEGDPDGSKGYQDRLDALRKTTKPRDLYAGIKGLVGDNEQRLVSQDVSQMIRRENGYRAGNDLKMETLVNKFSSLVDRWSNQESRDFMHNMELGKDQGDTMKNQLAGVLRTSLDDARDRINGVNGNFQDYLENYFPHIWANVGKGMEVSKQLRGLTGNESFLKNRELETFNEGIKQGLQPVTYNPLKLVSMRVEQMNRYAMKEQIKKEFVSSNNAVFIEPGKPVPDGFVPLDDRAFEAAGGLGGRYFAPQPVAKIFNNFTSTGLSGKGVIPFTSLSAYDMLRSTNNTLNQFQLGLSGLHGTFTTVNSIVSEISRGAARAVNGDVSGGLKTAFNALDVKGRYDLGRNLIAHLKDPNSFQELSSLADAFQRAGGRAGVDKILGTSYTDAFKSSYKNAMDDAMPANKKAAAWGKVAGNAIGATLETFSKPIMDHIVPNLKVGAFAKMANEILADNVGKPQSEIDGKLQQAWDNVDDRFGQMVYDNLFWNKTAKDIAMITTRAPGWNIGTFRAGGGGLFDLAKSVKDATRTKRFQITDRTAYLGTVVASTMAINGILQLALTGSGPSSLVDYFFPKTGTKDGNGEDNRLMPKMYTYDYINAVHDPVGTALHKVSPLMGTINELHANKSFYGREIYDPGSSVGGRVAQMAGYAMKQYEPFSLSNYQEQKTRGASGLSSVLGSALGVLPAPKWAGRSDAENLAHEYHAESMAQGGEEGDVYDKHQKYVQLQADIQNGSVTPDELGKRVNSGEIPTSFLEHIYDKQQTPNLERWTKALSPQRAMKVFDRATPEEKQRLVPVLMDKLNKLDPSEIPAYAQKINEAQYHPDTHAFSLSKYAAANPGADHQAAASEAQQKGYEVHP